MPTSPRILVSLQGLRAVAALLVVVDHSLATLALKTGRGFNADAVFFTGGFGVNLFFVISGFVMVMSHHQDFHQGRSLSFLSKRVGRIAPFYYLAAGLYALKLALQGTPPSTESLLLSAFFIPHQVPGDEYGHPFYGLGWTLQYEMFFYLAFAFSLSTRFGRGISMMVLTFVALVSANALGLFNANSPIGFLSQPIVLYFLAGVLLGALKIRAGHWHGMLSVSPEVLLAGAVALTIGCIALFLATGGGIGAFAPFFCIATCALCMLSRERPSASPIATLMMSVGNASYAIYLTHSFVVGPAGRIMAMLPRMPSALFCFTMIVVCSVVGIATHRYVEKPLLRAWRRATESASR